MEGQSELSGSPVNIPDELLRDFWGSEVGGRESFGMDVLLALAHAFVAEVHVDDLDKLRAAAHKGLLFCANHQTMIESVMFVFLISPLVERHIGVVAKNEHKGSWLGRMVEALEAEGLELGLLHFIERGVRQDVGAAAQAIVTGAINAGQPLLVHVEGTRRRSCRQPVKSSSGIFESVAAALGACVAPVRFGGGLPIEPAPERLDWPLGFGRQMIHVGQPIVADRLISLPLNERTKVVTAKINELRPRWDFEQPTNKGPIQLDDPLRWERRLGVERPAAVMLAALERWPEAGVHTRQLIVDLCPAVLNDLAAPAIVRRLLRL